MNIAVCIKQVPDTNDIKWSKENNIIREGASSILNPYDEFAIQAALDIKEKYGARITVISMGPKQATEVLEYALSKGCDEAILLTDKKFAGSDTLATGKTLAKCIKAQVPGFQLVVCGQFAIDGDTAQTGPSIASHLGISQVTFLKEIIMLNTSAKTILVKQELEDGYNMLEADLPCVLCTLKGDEKSLYIPKIADYIRASKLSVQTCSADDIGLLPDECGIKGSPTFVSKAFRPQINRKAQMADCEEDCANTVLEKIFEVYEK
ncbi:electron transfer flavoprotein, beta subunit [Candidatus Gastranaerophilus sp. (ex Termes propinquus)]|nr:electron transfer flavoprotein, beta subunit [Candidatus Gastranaerophilus sp. (ex Termes propinquus)]